LRENLKAACSHGAECLDRVDRPEYLFFPQGKHQLKRPPLCAAYLDANVDWLSFWLQGNERPAAWKDAQYGGVLALVMDCHSREPLGWPVAQWKIQDRGCRSRASTNRALRDTGARAEAVPASFGNGLIFASHSYTALVRGETLQHGSRVIS